MKKYLLCLILLLTSLQTQAQEPVAEQGFGCDTLSGFASNIQEKAAKQQCKTLEKLYEYQQKVCDLKIVRHLSKGPSEIVSLQYNIEYQCQGEVLKDSKSYKQNWLKDGRAISTKNIWYSLLDDERDAILKEVVADQDPDARCPKPKEPSQLDISENALTFSGFYPNLDNQVQREACDIGVLRPPMFLDSFIETDGIEDCHIPEDLAVRASQLLVLMDSFLKDSNDKQLAQEIWDLFPKNYRELTFMAGYWWQPGWDKIADNIPITWRELSATEASSQAACLSPLYYYGEKDLPKLWHSLYNQIDKAIWITTNFRLQSGIWQADSLNNMAEFYPEDLNDIWDEKAEAQAWNALSVADITGILAWHNTTPSQTEACENNKDCSIINPIDVDKLPLNDAEKSALKGKIEAAKIEYLK
ncbi:MAG: hypothetical protein ACK5MJ_07110 [Alphaproteobacteria bacterium]